MSGRSDPREQRERVKEKAWRLIGRAREIEARSWREARPLSPAEMDEWDQAMEAGAALKQTYERMERSAKAVRELAQERSGLDDPERTALHEAGHAVMAVLGGISLTGVQLRRVGWEDDSDRSRSLGRVTHWGHLRRGSLQWAQMQLAGIAAEREAGYEVLTATDYEFRDVLDELGRHRAVDELVETQRDLRAHWSAVRRVADALLRDWEVRPERVQQIVAAERASQEINPAGIAARQAILSQRRSARTG